MRQVPHYLIIGNGRMARHMDYYFQALGLSHQTWARATHPISQLSELITHASHILILISDEAIDDFIQKHLLDSQKILVHFSGSLTSEYAHMAHPLMSFNQSLYTQEIYRSIWFITETPGAVFANLLPGFPDHHAAIPRQSKALYHSLCVLSSNFTCLLWQKLITTLEQDWDVPPEAAHPILKQVMNNIINNPNTALTGPLVRNDQQTIHRNLQALEQDPYQVVYQAFVSAYQQQEKQ